MNEQLNFGQALEAMKAGRRISRAGWNGRGMHAYLVQAENRPGEDSTGAHVMVRCNPHMWIKNVDGTATPWVPSTGDCLAEDWSAK